MPTHETPYDIPVFDTTHGQIPSATRTMSPFNLLVPPADEYITENLGFALHIVQGLWEWPFLIGPLNRGISSCPIFGETNLR
jgi:hypothetical protein